jgi:murein DD-endopeptidase MepM/ murein hydrolase activator NlpD
MIKLLLTKKKFLAGTALLLSGWLVAGFLLFTGWSPANKAPNSSKNIVRENLSVPVQPLLEESGAESEKEVEVKELAGTVKRGETLSSLLGDYLSSHEICCLAEQCEDTFSVKDIRAGRPYCMLFEDGTFKCFTYEIDADEQLLINYEGEIFKISKEAISYRVERSVVSGAISGSLFLTVAELGEGAELACRLSDIFAWDIDFMRDLRQGDSFRVLVEKRYRDGEFAGYGNLLAAEFVNRGEVFHAVYYKDEDTSAYYDLNGRSLKKAFLKAPLVYSHISSTYSNRRFHPVLNIYRPHRAIDYAAPTGTPVRAVASGVVTQRSYDRQNGNKIRLRHANRYETTYIHLSRFGRGIKVGRKVDQGRVIGYVGATGLATGPHLDFRVFKNGRAINPLKMEKIPSAPLPKKVLPEFNLKVKEYFAALDSHPSVERMQKQFASTDKEG